MVRLNCNCSIRFLSGLLLVSSLVLLPGLCQPGEAAQHIREANGDGLNKPRVMYQVPRRWADKNEVAATIANSYGVPYSAVLKYCNENGCLEDACRIAYMAMLTDNSFDRVAGLKNKDNTWILIQKESAFFNALSSSVLRNQTVYCERSELISSE
ncbi:hypothetical protein [uncultured Anaerovibrio sp.]|uniref:hypothetical protein n=1 Tax=uncultured Anaerovibrio sp. TaxID=361586 RepID=UPI002634B815|nr:hypothetical protein [uncultured Anaerovibrio sp.]